VVFTQARNPSPVAHLRIPGKLIMLLGALMPVSSTVLAQGPLPLTPSKIEPYVTMWRVTIVKPDGTKLPQGIWSDQVIRGSYMGHPSIRRVQGMTYSNGRSATWMNVLDAATLRPLMDVQRHLDGTVITREFSDTTVVATRQRSDGTRPDTNRSVTKGVVYDYLAGTYGLLFAALPLSTGYSATFLSIDGLTDSIRMAVVKVVGRESVGAGAGQTAMAWQIADGDLTYYVGEHAPYVLKLVELLPDGAHMMWELP
jgi:hypothetical protein